MDSIHDVNKNEKSVHKEHNSSIKYREFKDKHSRHTMREI